MFGRRVAAPAQIELFHLVAQRVAADAQQHGGPGLIAIRFFKRVDEQAPFGFLERDVPGRRAFERRRATAAV